MMNTGLHSFLEFFEGADSPATSQRDDHDLALDIRRTEQIYFDLMENFFEFFEDADHPTTFQTADHDLALPLQVTEQASHDFALGISVIRQIIHQLGLGIQSSDSVESDLALTIQAISLLGILLGLQETAVNADHDLLCDIEAAGVSLDVSMLLTIRNDDRMIN